MSRDPGRIGAESAVELHGLDPESTIAITGMACRVPGASDPERLWRNLVEGVESIEDLTREELVAAGVDPALLADPAYVPRAAVLDGVHRWDAGFFAFSPGEAAIMDPQQRHFLEMSWEAMERAGHAPGDFEGPVGVFAGCGPNTWMMFQLLGSPELLREQGFFLVRHIGNDKDFLATRVSYHLNLRGPGVGVQTACSTSLSAVHLAVQSLIGLECDMALAGGITITFPNRLGYLWREGEILSPDGRCRAFDAEAQGTVLGDGGAVVVLRRLGDALRDGDTIHAVIRGSAMNNDGSAKVGYMAPSVDGQAEVIAEALALSGVDPASIGYVEAHGTGTAVGDPIEVAALARAYDRGGVAGPAAKRCGLGSVKTNIGHLDTAAGVVGLIKAALAVERGEIPPSLHFIRPNPGLHLEETPFRVVAEREEWPGRAEHAKPRRAGVSSLGVGGTNVHLLLEEPPVPVTRPSARERHLFVLSGRSRGVVERASVRLVDHLDGHSELDTGDVAWTLATGRTSFAERRIVVAEGAVELSDALLIGDPERVEDHRADGVRRGVAFLFAGGGAQYPGMARGLLRSEPVFRRELERGLGLLPARVRAGVEAFLRGEEAEAERPTVALPALFLVQIALARLWASRGVEPEAMIGHSMGEYSCACLAGVLSLEEALDLVVLRGELFERVSGGGMLGVPLSEEALRARLGPGLSVAAANGPELSVASGPAGAIERLAEELAAEGIEARRIHIDVAAHSAMLEPILEPFRERLQRTRLSPPRIPFASNLTGEWIRADEATDPEYWVRQLRETVRFSKGLERVLEERDRVLLEVGPGRTLATLARLHPARETAQEIFTSMRHPTEEGDDGELFLRATGRLWQRGVELRLDAAYEGERRRRVPLPTYPFEWEVHRVDPEFRLDPQAALELRPRGRGVAGREGAAGREAGVGAAAGSGAPTESPAGAAGEGWLHRVMLRDAGPVEAEAGAGAQADGAGPVGTLVLVPPGEGGARARLVAAFGDHAVHLVEPGDRDAFARLLARGIEEGDESSVAPLRVIWASALGAGTSDASRDEGAPEGAVPAPFLGLFTLGRLLAEEPLPAPVEIVAVTAGGWDTRRGGALVAGPVRVLPAELEGVEARWIDLRADAFGEGAGDAGAEVLAELAHELTRDDGEPVVVLRGGRRMMPAYRTVSRSEGQGGKEALPGRPVCLVTGGLGGLGLEVARHLYRTRGARLVLVGRRGLPPETRSEGLVAEGADPRVLRGIEAVRALREEGAEVLVLAADVSDRGALEGVRERVREAYGGVDLVVHAAGVLDDGLVAGRELDRAARVLAPKARGGKALLEVFEEERPWVVLFSSLSTEAGLPGQIDYAAANAWLDAAARGGGGARVTSIGWSAWGETGMVADPLAGLEAWPPLEGEGWESARGASLDAVDREGGRVRVRLRDGRLWYLDEHRMSGGPALLPGAGYVELIRAAGAELGLVAGERWRLEELFFLEPFIVGDGRTRELEVRLPEGGEGEVVVAGRGAPAGAWTVHARGRLRRGGAMHLNKASFSVAHQNGAHTVEVRRQDLAFGPRWDHVEEVRAGEKGVFVTLRLPERFRGDLVEAPLHPALLDNATALAGPLLPGFGEEGVVYVPGSFGSLEFAGALPERIVSWIRPAEGSEGEAGEGLALFDVTIAGEGGKIVAEARQFVMVRVATEELGAEVARRAEADEARLALAGAAAAEGMPTAVGLALFDRVLEGEGLFGHLVVAEGSVEERITALRARALGRGAGAVGAASRRAREEAEVPLSELRRVEAALLELDSVAEAAVTAHPDRPGEVRLVAHVVPDAGRFTTVSELRRALRGRLPDELVPRNFVQLEALPRGARGEVARDELRDPFAPVDDHVEPATPLERAIAEIWGELLGTERIGVHDNFLDVGGHSLLAMRAILRMERATGVRVGPVEINLFTLGQLARHIEEAGGGVAGASGEGGADDPGGAGAGVGVACGDDAGAEGVTVGAGGGLIERVRRLIPGRREEREEAR